MEIIHWQHENLQEQIIIDLLFGQILQLLVIFFPQQNFNSTSVQHDEQKYFQTVQQQYELN